MSQTKEFKGTIDIGIITIKEEEMQAVLERLPGDPQVITGQRNYRNYNIFDFNTTTGSKYRLAVLRCAEQGNGEAHEATRDLLEDLSPHWIILVGIAGAAPSTDFTLGDVIISDRINDFSVEAALSTGESDYSIGGGPLHRAAQGIISNLPVIAKKLTGWNSPESIRRPLPQLKASRTAFYGDKDWQAKVKKSIAPLLKTEAPRPPVARAGTIASSDRLLKNTEILSVWRKVARGISAIEMESAGAYRAARDRVPMFAIRGISDIIGLNRSAEWTDYACHTAAAFMHALLSAGSIPIESTTGKITTTFKIEKPSAKQTPNPTTLIQDTKPLAPEPEPQYPADSIQSHLSTALTNIGAIGDTDIFPFPLEHHVFHDKKTEVIKLLTQVHETFDEYIKAHPPTHESTLSQLGYTAYRWVTQLDPFWNAYYLALVISLGENIESRRLPKSTQTVFSYRFLSQPETGHIFDKTIGWPLFQERSLVLSQQYSWVVKCDIADFYARISHDQLVFALRDCSANREITERLRKFLANYKGHAQGHAHSGIPVGGPASRLLSELLLNRIDHLLTDSGIAFCRFSDDYHLFAPNREVAYNHLIKLTEVLQQEEGLTLQKLKTRVMQSSEFSKLSEAHESPDATQDSTARAFMAVRLRYDPYSPTAEEDYERLRNEVARFDILGMLGREMSKSRVHEALTRQLIKAVRYLKESDLNNTIRSLIDNYNILTPVFSVVLMLIRELFEKLDDATKTHVCKTLHQLFNQDAPLLRIDIHADYAIRIIAHMQTNEHQSLLVKLFDSRNSPLLKRDIILILAHWRATHFLSSLKRKFVHFHPWVRRAYIVASYILESEGEAWRTEASPSFDKFESLVNSWANERSASNKSGLLL